MYFKCKINLVQGDKKKSKLRFTVHDLRVNATAIFLSHLGKQFPKRK